MYQKRSSGDMQITTKGNKNQDLKNDNKDDDKEDSRVGLYFAILGFIIIILLLIMKA